MRDLWISLFKLKHSIFTPPYLDKAVSLSNMLALGAKSRWTETKMVRSTIPRCRLSARHPKLIHSSLSEQSNGNGNSSGLKMNLNFPLRDFECSAKMCDFALHCDDTKGEPADAGRLLPLKLFTLCLRSTPQNNSGCAFLLFISNKTVISVPAVGILFYQHFEESSLSGTFFLMIRLSRCFYLPPGI